MPSFGAKSQMSMYSKSNGAVAVTYLETQDNLCYLAKAQALHISSFIYETLRPHLPSILFTIGLDIWASQLCHIEAVASKVVPPPEALYSYACQSYSKVDMVLIQQVLVA